MIRPGPNFSVQDVARGWTRGLRQVGCSVVDFNFDERLSFYGNAHIQRDGEWVQAFDPEQAAILAAKGIEAAAYEFDPDIAVIVSGFFIPPAIYEMLRLRGVKVVLLHTESPYEDDKQVRRAQYADLNILNDPANIDRFPPGSMYLPHCYDPDLHHPRPLEPENQSDFAFVGTGYPGRIKFLESVGWDGIKVLLGGYWRELDPSSPLLPFVIHDLNLCLDNADTARLYASTKASVNLYRKEADAGDADGWAMGPREVELAACGTFFLREPRPESDEVLSMLPTFDSPGDFEEKLRWWLAHDDVREETARLARLAIADRTFDRSAARLLTALDA